MQEIVVIGGGLAGVLLAISLARRGYRVDVYERRPDPRGERADFGRSINLALSARGAHGLSQAGLLDRVLANSVPMRDRAIHSLAGEVVYQPFGRSKDEYLSSVDRQILNVDLLNATEEYPGITLHFHERLTGIDFSTMKITLFHQVSQTTQERAFRHIVAADGAFSTARKIMIGNGLAQFVQDELAYGYKELPITTAHGHDMTFEALHLWPRGFFSMIANPNTDRSFGCTIFMPHEGETASFSQLRTKEDVESFFRRYFPDALERMPNVAEHFLSRPTGRLPTVKGGPWYFEDKLLMLGDAAHALVPFFAQGMNSAFEDCTIFSHCLERCHDRWDEAFPAFFEARKADADAIAAMTMQNYREIQDYIADERFLLRKAIEQELMRRFPRIYTSMHICVMFTRVRYAFAEACGALQAALLDTICEGVTRMDEIDWSRVEPRVAAYGEEVRRQAALFQVDFESAGLARA